MKDKFKICYLGNGESIHTKRWVNHFAGLGHDVHLISSTKADFENVTVHQIEGAGYLDFIRKIFKCRKLVRKIKPDLIHAHFVTDYGFLGAMTGVHPLVISPWGSDITRQPDESMLFRFMVKYALKRADAVHCGDDTMAERIRVLVGDTGNIYSIRWGVDSEFFVPASARNPDEIRIIYLRISHDNYRTQTLLGAMPEVLKKHKNVRFMILKKGDHLDRTIEAIGKMDDRNRIEMIEPVPYDSMPEMLNGCDIYVDTVYNQTSGCGIGVTAQEAMSCGLPIVIANTSGYNQFVEHGVNGYVYQGMDSKALARALDELILDEGMRKRLGEKAREFILAGQSWQANMQEMERLYRKLIEKGDGK